jgi:hypothetical protein
MFRQIISGILFLIISNGITAQTVTELNKDGELSLRGLSVVDDNVVWVSGSKGTVGRSTDGGKIWKWMEVKGYKKSEFRDIEAFSENTAIVLSVGEPAYILKTTNGGKSWKKVYENKAAGMFLDAMEFSDPQTGYVVGDPIDRRFFIAKTTDGGNSWQAMDPALCAKADSAEACFASSGTNIRMITKEQFAYVSGGSVSNLIIGSDKIRLPVIQGKNSTGANSFAVKDSTTFIVVGGDFTDLPAMPNCVFTVNSGKTWNLPIRSPSGYKSCVEYISGNTWISCGLSGIDISIDNGLNWKQISKESYHACRKAKNGRSVYFSGNKSRIGKLNLE